MRTKIFSLILILLTFAILMNIETKKAPQTKFSSVEKTASIPKTNQDFTQPKTDNTLIVSKPSSTELSISNKLSNGQILFTKFKQTDWGTWNIDSWHSSDTFLASGSDWEYVFKVSEYPDTAYDFSGGYHGRETFKSLKILNHTNDTPLDIKIGDSIKLNHLKIIEETALTFDKAMIKKYADVQRVYTIMPSKIMLNTTFTFTHDVYMGTSYVCMFPVSKEYGRYIRFNDTNAVMATPPIGKTLTNNHFENFLGREKTLSVDIWGDSNPQYMFKIWIGNSQMVDMFKNDLKTFYWDCNTFGNKLYFSKYNDKDHKKIEAGTVWNHLQGWELHIKQ